MPADILQLKTNETADDVRHKCITTLNSIILFPYHFIDMDIPVMGSTSPFKLSKVKHIF